ncbi:unnamed protein product [Anisakis simplex]|uniref:Acyl-CoA dehydrogenase 6 n=1 Tax=Anisakis simplex TaxID=6269 RepID=A0A0M3K9F5_ANISI|nr:unnamed protein product [Anisakis simplex]
MPAVSPKLAPQITQHVLYGPRHLQFRRTLGKLIDKEINPNVDEWETRKLFPAKKVFKKLGQLGVLGVNKPTDYGGLGLDFSYNIAIAEEMGRIHCAAIPMAVAVQTDMATPALADFGSDSLKREFLQPTILGDMVSCIGVSEACAGSDVAAIRTHAHWHGNDLIINGSKQWITNGYQADWICLLANTNKTQSIHRNKSLICVPLNEPGIHRSKGVEKLGMHSSDTAEIYFDSVVHYRLAELQTEIEAVRSLLYRAVMERVSGTDVTLLASMGKLKAARLARTVTDSCLQVIR